MSYLNDFDISGYGLSAQRFRMNVISSNIANAQTTRTAEGGPYRRQEVIFKEMNFDKILNDRLKNSQSLLEYENPLDDPSHPDANANGYVAFPNINPVIEMADLLEATRAYQANVASFQNAKTIAQSAISLISGQA